MIKLLIVCTLCLMAASPAAAEAPAWANYTVTLDATWSATTHPLTFPPSPHFSGLIGGTHNASVAFWEAGQLASTGIKQMAEWGSQSALAAEVATAITAGNAGEVVSGDVLWVSPGQVTTSFTISPDHPLISLVTMIAPSPDWFAGVNGLSLLDGQQWLSEVVVDLYPYDAGTDSGLNYTSGDQVTVPADPITTIVTPFAAGVPVGTLTFRLDAAASVDLPTAVVPVSVAPNPFNPTTELRYSVPAGTQRVDLAVYDAKGRLVQRLAADTAAGPHVARWEGRTADGLAVASGVYFARLTIDGQIVVSKMALIR